MFYPLIQPLFSYLPRLSFGVGKYKYNTDFKKKVKRIHSKLQIHIHTHTFIHM